MLNEVIERFRFQGRLVDQRPYGSGHINDTYLLTFEGGNGEPDRAILQRMNKNVFPKPAALMENIMNVTAYLRGKILENGGDPERETLNVIPTKDGEACYVEAKGDYWRSYVFITDATSYDQVEDPEHFYQSAVAFGRFQRLLSDYPADTLHEIIEGFHDTRARYSLFEKAVREDRMGRAASVMREIESVSYTHLTLPTIRLV